MKDDDKITAEESQRIAQLREKIIETTIDFHEVDEYVELELERMEAELPLGGVTRSVWGWAESGPKKELALIVEESGDQLSAFINNELRKRGVLLDARTLSALVEIVATAMIKQHDFTQKITDNSHWASRAADKAAEETLRKLETN